MKGFSLVELLIVIGGTIIIVALTLPVGVNFYRSQIVAETRDDILLTIRKAQFQAGQQKNDSSFGVKFFPDSYVLFQGSSYGARITSEDENFSLANGVSVSGIDELVFAKTSGLPDTIGTINITFGSDTYKINVNSQGKIERG